MRKTRRPRSSERREWLAFPTLVALVAGLVAFGTLHYSLLLAVGSAIFVGFFGWLWWHRTFNTRPPARTRQKSRR